MATKENKRYVHKIVYGINGDVDTWRILAAMNGRQTKSEKVGTITNEVNGIGYSVAAVRLTKFCAKMERREVSLIGKNAVDAQQLDNMKTALIVWAGKQVKSMIARGELVLCDTVKPTHTTLKRNALNEARYKAAIDKADMVESED